MPKIPADKLETIAATLLQKSGSSEEEAAIIARHSIGANLAGHDSHGIIQIPTYIDRVKKEHIIPGAEFEIVRETPTTTVIDGHWGWGYVVSERAMQMTIDKAEKSGVAATTVSHQSHVGRVADYPLMAAEAGMIGMMTADSGRSPKSVAPFGGREPRLGTNPISMAMPSNLDGPFFIDMATSGAAAGKVKLAQSRGTPIPEGWLVDKDGNPTTDPNLYGNGAVILPLGGAEGHKGYGLAFMVYALSAGLGGFGQPPSPRGYSSAVFLQVIDPEAFSGRDAFNRELAILIDACHGSPPAPGFRLPARPPKGRRNRLRPLGRNGPTGPAGRRLER